MAGELLLDTAALVSLLDRSQHAHQACAEFYRRWDGAVVSTEAVLTEASHLLGRVRGGREASVDFFLTGGAVLVPSTLASLGRSRDLLGTYSDLPMDLRTRPSWSLPRSSARTSSSPPTAGTSKSIGSAAVGGSGSCPSSRRGPTEESPPRAVGDRPGAVTHRGTGAASSG